MTDEPTDEDKAAMAELRVEMAKKAKKAGVKVTAKMTAEDIEQAIGEAALEVVPEADPEKEAMAQHIAELQAQIAEMAETIAALSSPPPDEPIGDLPEQTEQEADDPEGDPLVSCSVLKKGAGQISNGAGSFYARKDIIKLPLSIADNLQERGFVEIDD